MQRHIRHEQGVPAAGLFRPVQGPRQRVPEAGLSRVFQGPRQEAIPDRAGPGIAGSLGSSPRPQSARRAAACEGQSAAVTRVLRYGFRSVSPRWKCPLCGPQRAVRHGGDRVRPEHRRQVRAAREHEEEREDAPFKRSVHSLPTGGRG